MVAEGLVGRRTDAGAERRTDDGPTDLWVDNADADAGVGTDAGVGGSGRANV